MDVYAANGICLMHLATFGDEDFMGKIRAVAQSCHGSSYQCTWAKRYVLKRSLQWRDMKEKVLTVCIPGRLSVCVCVCVFFPFGFT